MHVFAFFWCIVVVPVHRVAVVGVCPPQKENTMKTKTNKIPIPAAKLIIQGHMKR